MSRVIFGISTTFLGDDIKSLRKLLGDWSQERLARELGCSGGAIRKWEKGSRHVNLSAVQRMATLAPTIELRARFQGAAYQGREPATNPTKSMGEQWAHIAVEVIFERAPEPVRAALLDYLEERAGRYGAPPSPSKPLPAPTLEEIYRRAAAERRREVSDKINSTEVPLTGVKPSGIQKGFMRRRREVKK